MRRLHPLPHQPHQLLTQPVQVYLVAYPITKARRILMTMLEAVYVDTVEEKRIVAIRPNPAFRPLLEIATMREGSGIVLVVEPPSGEEGQPAEITTAPPPGGLGADGNPCLRWRRGGSDLHLQYFLRLGSFPSQWGRPSSR